MSAAPGEALPAQICTFGVGSMLLGVEVTTVQEVLPPIPITRVPRAPLGVHGLINLRGQIVTVLDLRHVLCAAEAAAGDAALNLVVRRGDRRFSVLVDHIGEVVDVAATRFEPAPSTLPEALRPLLPGAWKLPANLVLALDLDLAVERIVAP